MRERCLIAIAYLVFLFFDTPSMALFPTPSLACTVADRSLPRVSWWFVAVG